MRASTLLHVARECVRICKCACSWHFSPLIAAGHFFPFSPWECWEGGLKKKEEIRGGRGRESEVPPLSKSIFPRMDSLLRPSGFVLLSAPFCVCLFVCVFFYACVYVCMSGRESVVLVLLSAPGVSLVSYQPPPPPPFPLLPHILSEGPSGQFMNLSALRFGAPSWGPRLSLC